MQTISHAAIEKTYAQAYHEARLILALLSQNNMCLVAAESCTGGLLASFLTSIPGASQHFCGSLVVYRDDSKSQWLGVEKKLLDDPMITSVSSQVTEALALETLSRTPEASLAFAVTGHLGPNAPANQLGIVHMTVVFKQSNECDSLTEQLLIPCEPSNPFQTRVLMQHCATLHALEFLRQKIETRFAV